MIKVLVVDDTPSEVALISSYLQAGGYTVISANNAKAALEQTKEQKPDIVITDVVMPGMSGFELCRSLKKDPETQQVRIVVCTSKNQELDRLWGMKQGADVYVTKPFSQEDIIRAVKSLAG